MSHGKDLLARFPDLYAGEDGVLAHLARVLGEELEEAEAALVQVMRAHWIATADNEPPPAGAGAGALGDMDRLLTLYLNVLGGTSLLRQRDRPSGEPGQDSDAVYRTRMQGLIRILAGGAATTRGIIDIVAANLGIVEDTPEACAAKETIRIDEFLPAPLSSRRQVALLQTLAMDNPNPEASGVEIRLSYSVPGGVPLTRLTVEQVAATEGAEAAESGARVVFPGTLAPGESLVMFAGGGGLHEGIAIPTEGALLLPPGTSHLRVSGQVGYAEVRVDRSLFDFSLFEEHVLEAPSPEQAERFALDIELSVRALHPGSFRVCIPWDIPGFTELLDAANDDARSRIAHIVDRVKAAGVYAEVCYEKRLHDQLDPEIRFSGHIERAPLGEDHGQEEANFDMASRQSALEEHEASDGLLLGAVFDFTSFDSLNGIN